MELFKQIICIALLIQLVLCNYMEVEDYGLNQDDHECEYLKESKDLICGCSRSSMVVPSISSLVAEYPDRQVESLSFSNCNSLDLNISTDGLESALYQLRVENIEYVTIRGVRLQHNDTLDLHVNNVKKHFNLIGDLKCLNCDSNTTEGEPPLPSLSLQIKDSVQANIQFVQLDHLNFRLKSRNVETIHISNSDMSSLQENGIEIFYTEKLEIKNSVFNASNSSLLLNHVDRFSLDHTIGISNDTFEILSASTILEFTCTVPQFTREGTYYSWDKKLCGPPGVSVFLSRRENMLETGGVSLAVIITCLAAFMLAGVILVILYLQKKGKLDSVL